MQGEAVSEDSHALSKFYNYLVSSNYYLKTEKLWKEIAQSVSDICEDGGKAVFVHISPSSGEVRVFQKFCVDKGMTYCRVDAEDSLSWLRTSECIGATQVRDGESCYNIPEECTCGVKGRIEDLIGMEDVVCMVSRNVLVNIENSVYQTVVSQLVSKTRAGNIVQWHVNVHIPQLNNNALIWLNTTSGERTITDESRGVVLKERDDETFSYLPVDHQGGVLEKSYKTSSMRSHMANMGNGSMTYTIGNSVFSCYVLNATDERIVGASQSGIAVLDMAALLKGDYAATLASLAVVSEDLYTAGLDHAATVVGQNTEEEFITVVTKVHTYLKNLDRVIRIMGGPGAKSDTPLGTAIWNLACLVTARAINMRNTTRQPLNEVLTVSNVQDIGTATVGNIIRRVLESINGTARDYWYWLLAAFFPTQTDLPFLEEYIDHDAPPFRIAPRILRESNFITACKVSKRENDSDEYVESTAEFIEIGCECMARSILISMGEDHTADGLHEQLAAVSECTRFVGDHLIWSAFVEWQDATRYDAHVKYVRYLTQIMMSSNEGVQAYANQLRNTLTPSQLCQAFLTSGYELFDEGEARYQIAELINMYLNLFDDLLTLLDAWLKVPVPAPQQEEDDQGGKPEIPDEDFMAQCEEERKYPFLTMMKEFMNMASKKQDREFLVTCQGFRNRINELLLPVRGFDCHGQVAQNEKGKLATVLGFTTKDVSATRRSHLRMLTGAQWATKAAVVIEVVAEITGIVLGGLLGVVSESAVLTAGLFWMWTRGKADLKFKQRFTMSLLANLPGMALTLIGSSLYLGLLGPSLAGGFAFLREAIALAPVRTALTSAAGVALGVAIYAALPGFLTCVAGFVWSYWIRKIVVVRTEAKHGDRITVRMEDGATQVHLFKDLKFALTAEGREALSVNHIAISLAAGNGKTVRVQSSDTIRRYGDGQEVIYLTQMTRNSEGEEINHIRPLLTKAKMIEALNFEHQYRVGEGELVYANIPEATVITLECEALNACRTNPYVGALPSIPVRWANPREHHVLNGVDLDHDFAKEHHGKWILETRPGQPVDVNFEERQFLFIQEAYEEWDWVKRTAQLPDSFVMSDTPIKGKVICSLASAKNYAMLTDGLPIQLEDDKYYIFGKAEGRLVLGTILHQEEEDDASLASDLFLDQDDNGVGDDLSDAAGVNTTPKGGKAQNCKTFLHKALPASTLALIEAKYGALGREGSNKFLSTKTIIAQCGRDYELIKELKKGYAIYQGPVISERKLSEVLSSITGVNSSNFDVFRAKISDSAIKRKLRQILTDLQSGNIGEVQRVIGAGFWCEKTFVRNDYITLVTNSSSPEISSEEDETQTEEPKVDCAELFALDVTAWCNSEDPAVMVDNYNEFSGKEIYVPFTGHYLLIGDSDYDGPSCYDTNYGKALLLDINQRRTIIGNRTKIKTVMDAFQVANGSVDIAGKGELVTNTIPTARSMLVEEYVQDLALRQMLTDKSNDFLISKDEVVTAMGTVCQQNSNNREKEKRIVCPEDFSKEGKREATTGTYRVKEIEKYMHGDVKEHMNWSEIVFIHGVAGAGKTYTLLQFAAKHREIKIVYLTEISGLIQDMRAAKASAKLKNLTISSFENVINVYDQIRAAHVIVLDEAHQVGAYALAILNGMAPGRVIGIGETPQGCKRDVHMPSVFDGRKMAAEPFCLGQCSWYIGTQTRRSPVAHTDVLSRLGGYQNANIPLTTVNEEKGLLYNLKDHTNESIYRRVHSLCAHRKLNNSSNLPIMFLFASKEQVVQNADMFMKVCKQLKSAAKVDLNGKFLDFIPSKLESSKFSINFRVGTNRHYCVFGTYASAQGRTSSHCFTSVTNLLFDKSEVSNALGIYNNRMLYTVLSRTNLASYFFGSTHMIEKMENIFGQKMQTWQKKGNALEEAGSLEVLHQVSFESEEQNKAVMKFREGLGGVHVPLEQGFLTVGAAETPEGNITLTNGALTATVSKDELPVNHLVLEGEHLVTLQLQLKEVGQVLHTHHHHHALKYAIDHEEFEPMNISELEAFQEYVCRLSGGQEKLPGTVINLKMLDSIRKTVTIIDDIKSCDRKSSVGVTDWRDFLEAGSQAGRRYFAPYDAGREQSSSSVLYTLYGFADRASVSNSDKMLRIVGNREAFLDDIKAKASRACDKLDLLLAREPYEIPDLWAASSIHSVLKQAGKRKDLAELMSDVSTVMFNKMKSLAKNQYKVSVDSLVKKISESTEFKKASQVFNKLWESPAERENLFKKFPDLNDRFGDAKACQPVNILDVVNCLVYGCVIDVLTENFRGMLPPEFYMGNRKGHDDSAAYPCWAECQAILKRKGLADDVCELAADMSQQDTCHGEFMRIVFKYVCFKCLPREMAAWAWKYYSKYSKHWSTVLLCTKASFRFEGNNPSGAKTTFFMNTLLLVSCFMVVCDPAVTQRDLWEHIENPLFMSQVQVSGNARAKTICRNRWPNKMRSIHCVLLKGDDLNVTLDKFYSIDTTCLSNQGFRFKLEVSQGYTCWCNKMFTDKGCFPDVIKVMFKSMTKSVGSVKVPRKSRLDLIKATQADLKEFISNIGVINFGHAAVATSLRFPVFMQDVAKEIALISLENMARYSVTKPALIFKTCVEVDKTTIAIHPDQKKFY